MEGGIRSPWRSCLHAADLAMGCAGLRPGGGDRHAHSHPGRARHRARHRADVCALPDHRAQTGVSAFVERVRYNEATNLAEGTTPAMHELRERLTALRDRIAHVMARL